MREDPQIENAKNLISTQEAESPQPNWNTMSEKCSQRKKHLQEPNLVEKKCQTLDIEPANTSQLMNKLY